MLAKAKKENVQIGELALLRSVATSKALVPEAKDGFVRAVDQVVPQVQEFFECHHAR
ncbi:MAG: hypothetical protein HYZ28_12190 [Myxococcales bacterium]|nr:hypothetical protein [Myxococcales bacterium]